MVQKPIGKSDGGETIFTQNFTDYYKETANNKLD